MINGNFKVIILLKLLCFSRTEVNDRVVVEPNLVRLQTLDHAKKEKAEEIILVLLVWLHRLVTQNINGSHENQIRSPVNPQINRKFSNHSTSSRTKNRKDTS
jgi:hypothetical protein